MKVVESAILSTDLAMYFKKRSQFLELIEGGEFDWQGEEKKEGNGIVLSICPECVFREGVNFSLSL